MRIADVMLRVPADPVPEITCERTENVFGMERPWRIRMLNSHVYTDGLRAFLLRGVQGPPSGQRTDPVLRATAVESVEQLEGAALEAVVAFWSEHLESSAGTHISLNYT